jgi:ribonuclease T
MSIPLSKRFRGFYPVVIDLETAGFDPKKNPILELAAVFLKMDEAGLLQIEDRIHFHLNAFQGSVLDAESLEFTGIKPDNPFRFAVEEKEALETLFAKIHEKIKMTKCERAVIVAHNATFDQSFLKASTQRCQLKNDPFHRFTTFDTASLAALAFGQTVLAKAVKAAGIVYDKNSAHSAKYDAEITAALFCEIVNKWQQLGGIKI